MNPGSDLRSDFENHLFNRLLAIDDQKSEQGKTVKLPMFNAVQSMVQEQERVASRIKQFMFSREDPLDNDLYFIKSYFKP